MYYSENNYTYYILNKYLSLIGNCNSVYFKKTAKICRICGRIADSELQTAFSSETIFTCLQADLLQETISKYTQTCASGSSSCKILDSLRPISID